MDESRVEQLLDDYRCGKRPAEWLRVDRNSSIAEGGMPTSCEDDTPSPWPQLPGYEIVNEIARGGMGVVFLARELALDRMVALKMVAGGLLAGPERISRFAAESKAIARLNHPNIVKVFDVGEYQGQPYFTMELVVGHSLRDILDGTPWVASRAARLVQQIAAAVHAAHEAGFVHRDLKPANILLSQGAEGDDPKVIDFGLAKNLDATALTLSGEAMGTPSYMAPEQTAGQNHLVGSGTDIYALGCVLYELLTGRVPFRAASIAQTLHQIVADQPAAPSSLNPNVPADLETICLKCLRKEPQRRYENSLELANDLQRYGEGLPIKARPTPRWERGLKWCQRNPMVATLSVIGFAAVIAAFGIWIRFTSQLSRQTTIAIRESERAQVSAEAARQSAIKAENAAEIQAEVMSFLHDMTYELSTLDSQDRLLTALHASREKVAKRLKHRPLQMAAHLLAMGETYGQIGKPEEGLEVVREAMDVFEKHDGLHSKNTTKAKLSEISLLNDMRNLDEAQQLAKALDEGSFDFFTQDRWEFRLLQSNININDGQYQIAEQQLIRFIDQMSAVEQTNPLQLLRAHEQLGVAMSHQGRFQDAGPHFEKRLKYALENFPVGHDDILAAQNTYGIFLANTGRPLEAIAIFRDALPVSINKRGEEDKHTIELMQNMAAALSRAEQYEESHRLFRKAIDYNLEHFGQANGYTLGAMINLSADFLTLKQYVEGFTLLEEKCDVAALESMQHPFAGRLVLNYVRLSLGAKAWERAGELLDVLDRINVSLTSPDTDLQEQARRAREELEAARE